MRHTMHEVTATARQGLAIGGPAEVGFDKTTLHYIPGSTLRGALAAAWITEHGPPQRAAHRLRQQFVALFEHDVRYGPLLADGSTLVPLTATWCKYPAGRACELWSQDAAVTGDAAHCPHCGGACARGRGHIDGVATIRTVRTALDQDGRALEATLRARHELPTGTVFRGHLHGWHDWLGQPRDILIGGQTSINGLTELAINPQAAPITPRPSPRPDGAVVITLTSPAIVVDDAGRPQTDLLPELCRLLNLPNTAGTRQGTRQWMRPIKVGGWHAASGLPKPTEYATAMGSVVVLPATDGIDSDRLAALAATGIGLRRTEGFGCVQVNLPTWHRPVQDTEAKPTAPGPLDRLRELRLLDNMATVTWLLDRARLVLIERERHHSYHPAHLMTERVAFHFDDIQAAAVLELFTSPGLGAALPLLEHAREQLTAQAPPGEPE